MTGFKLTMSLVLIAIGMLPTTAATVLLLRPQPPACILVQPTSLPMWWV